MGSDLLSWQTGYGNLNSTFDYGVGIGGLGFSGFGTMNMPKDGLVSKNYNPADSADLGGNGGANDVEISNEIIFLLSGSNISLNSITNVAFNLGTDSNPVSATPVYTSVPEAATWIAACGSLLPFGACAWRKLHRKQAS